MKWARWTDHLPLWVALGSTLATGIYGPGEAALMATPLALAAIAEAVRLDLGRYHRWLEVGALAFFLLDLLRGQGVFPVVIHTLFVIGGVRLLLPREITQRRQILLIGFLLFLATTVTTADLAFLGWTLLWMGAATTALLQQSWEHSAQLRRGLLWRTPYARIPLWLSAALLLGTGCFLIIPRVTAGLRPTLMSGLGAASQAGLGEKLDLSLGGPIEPNPAVVLRIVPPPGVEPTALRGLQLLRGMVLESNQGQQWVPSEWTPAPRLQPPSNHDLQAEFVFTPSPHGILTFPGGLTSLLPRGAPLRAGSGASLRWLSPRSNAYSLTATWNPDLKGLPEPSLSPRRAEALTELAPEHADLRQWSLRFAPAILPAPALAQELAAHLRTFRYTLDNPSGSATHPLEDFLDRTQAGHCEYFASAMALMLRARGIPARVVNGYRLGPWIPEGGYFRVSQNEAHSWVEYWDEGYWKTSDPTPAAGSATGLPADELGVLSRWLDALNYQWDRHVIRFSAQDQEEGLSWIQEKAQGWEWHWKTPSRSLAVVLATLAVSWALWRTRARWHTGPEGPGRIPALRPLLRRLRRLAPPLSGDSARAWLLRLATLRPERRKPLEDLADAVDSQAYGGHRTEASTLARLEASAWKGWKP